MSDRWARNATGKMIHRSECRYASIPWDWATDATDDEMVLIAAEYGWHRLGRCCCADLEDRRMELRLSKRAHAIRALLEAERAS